MAIPHLVTPDGAILLPGAQLHAVKGVHAGTHWRLDRIFHNGVTHVLRCSRYVRRVGRVVEHFHPSVFGLDVIEVSRFFKITRRDLAACWHKIDDGLLMGFLALIPLGFFEAYHGGELFRHLLEKWGG